jgi:hypothetical protein
MGDRLEIRAREPVAQCLIRRLIVPRVYFGAKWPHADSPVDVLLIDRDGTGDAHLVTVRRTAEDALREVDTLLHRTKAPFRWIALLRGTDDDAVARVINSHELFLDASPGRVGIIEIVEMRGDLGANIRVRAERFADPVYAAARRFSKDHEANIQFGE